MRKREKALIFYEHLEKHLNHSDWLIMCKICNKSIIQIVNEKKREETLKAFRKAQDELDKEINKK